MKLNTKLLEGTWCKFGKGANAFELLIRPFPSSMNPVRMDGGTTMGAYAYNTFVNCVLDWKDLMDESDKPLECNEENKRMVFDNVDGIGAFVDREQEKLSKKFKGELKN